MNGVHDMGGMHGMGPVRAEIDEPVFHEQWEARVYVLTRAIGAWRKWNIDTGRFYIERIAPADYLRMSYYEKWYVRLVELLVKAGMVSRQEVESGVPEPGSPKLTPPLRAEHVPAMALNRNVASSHEPAVRPRFTHVMMMAIATTVRRNTQTLVRLRPPFSPAHPGTRNWGRCQAPHRTPRTSVPARGPSRAWRRGRAKPRQPGSSNTGPEAPTTSRTR